MCISGWTGRFSVWSPRLSNRGGPERVADVEEPKKGALQAAFHHRRSVHHRAAPVGRQLRSPLWFHIRFPAFVRVIAVYLLRSVRQTEEDRAHMGLSSLSRLSFYLFDSILLHNPGIRLQGLLVPQLFAVDTGFLCIPKHQFPARGARGMTFGQTVRNRIF